MNNSLDHRSRLLLKTLIERYIEEGTPVGSRSLSKFSGLEVSPATIRNVMSDLEELGLIASPHTSAGRIPTPRGYRLFVDSLITVQPYEMHDQSMNQSMAAQLNADQPQRLIESAAHMLSSLSSFAGVITTPKRSAVFSHLEFLRLGERRILLIIVTPEGDVQNRILTPERDYSSSELIEAANFINSHFAGHQMDEVRQRLSSDLAQLRTDMSSLMEAAVRVSAAAMSEPADQVLISGERNLLGANDLSSNMDRLKQLFSLFEQKTALLQLLHASGQAQGVQIFIGGDSDLVPMDDMTVVTAPYEVNGTVVGTLGVVGPTRMAYDRIIPIVDITARMLSNALNAGFPGAQR